MARRGPKSDPQRHKVYSAEYSFGRRQRYDIGMTLKQARMIADEVCSLYRVPPVKVRYEKRPHEHSGATMEWESGLKNPRIVANSAWNKLDILILLHELSHWIDANYFDSKEAHGANFVGIAAWLYGHYLVIPPVAYRVILDRFGIRYRQIGRCSPKALRKRGRAEPSPD